MPACRPACFAAWRVEPNGITVECDVRSGGEPVELGNRVLTLCQLVMRVGSPGESAFAAARAFCKEMCPAPRLADHVVYGIND